MLTRYEHFSESEFGQTLYYNEMLQESQFFTVINPF